MQRWKGNIPPQSLHYPIAQYLTHNIVQRPVAIRMNSVRQVDDKRVGRTIDDQGGAGEPGVPDGITRVC